jgi:hypothetical protein
MKNTTSNWTDKSITVNGTEEQISLAAWLAKELNDAPSSRQAMVAHEYPGTAGSNDDVRVYFLANTNTPQELQEAVNITRSVADIMRFFPCNEIRAIVARGTPQQIEMSQWLLGELDQPAGSLKPGHREHPYPSDPRASLTQIYVLTNIDTPQGIQEIVNGTRSLADVQRCFPYNSRRVLAMRASTEQIAFADWILGQLDKPAAAAPDTATHEYKYNTGNARDTASVARVFFLNHVEGPQQLMELVAEVRTATNIQRTFPNSQARAIMMRGTGDQISRAELMLKDK